MCIVDYGGNHLDASLTPCTLLLLFAAFGHVRHLRSEVRKVTMCILDQLRLPLSHTAPFSPFALLASLVLLLCLFNREAVIWLEDYLSRWNRILLLVSHSQDFLNNVCTHMIHFTNRRRLVYYDGNYDQFVKTKMEKEENQLKQYKWEQEQIKSMKEYIARFGHGTSKNAKQAQSKEKVLAKMIRNGLTEKPEEEKPLNFKFTDPGHLPPPVLAFHDVSFGYPNCEALYTNVNFGVDLDSRVALVGPNGAGKVRMFLSWWEHVVFVYSLAHANVTYV